VNIQLPGIKQNTLSGAQLKFFQATTVVLAIVLMGAICYYEYILHSLQPITIAINGTPIATVDSINAARAIIRTVHSEQVGAVYLTADHPHFKEDVEFVRSSSATPIDSDDAAGAKLAAATHTVVDADVIIVNRKPLVALPDVQTAQTAVDELRDHYASLPPSDPIEERPTFVQDVTIERRTVPAEIAKTNADDAAAVLWSAPPPKTYVVESGQTGWAIARKFKMTFSQFLQANAGRDVNRLAPGDTVNVSQDTPPVDVIVKKTQEEKQIFGGTGVRQLTMEVTYIDGVATGTPVTINMITLHRATPSRIVN
jgi:LysM repeat protein